MKEIKKVLLFSPIWILLIFFSHINMILALDPSATLSDYIHEVWQTEDGLPDNCIFAVTQTRDGYIWFGTQQGLVRFDGYRFYTFNSSNTRKIKNNYVRTLLEDHKGNLWFGGSGSGLIQYKNGEFRAYSTNDGLSSDNVRSIYEDRAGNLWIGTRYGGLNFFNGEKFTIFSKKEGLSNNYVLSILEDSKGNLWVGTYGGGLYRFSDGKFIKCNKRISHPQDYIWSIHEDSRGNLWFGTYGRGLTRYKIKNGKISNYTTRDGLSNDYVRSIYEDRAGNLWVGTQGGGLNCFKNGKFTSFTTTNGLSHNFVYTIYEDCEGNLWIGTFGGGLNVLKNSKFINYTTKQGLSNDFVRSIYEDREGCIWIGTYGGGVNRFKNGEFKTYTKNNGFLNDYARTVVGDYLGNIWVGTPEAGLIQFKVKKGKFISYSTNNGLSDNYVNCLYQDRRGNLWIGTHKGGLNRFKNGTFKTYTKKDGLPSNSIRAIYEDQEGNLWIGTSDKGLCRKKDDIFSTYTRKDGLSNNIVNTIYEDQEKNLWIGTFSGLNRFKNGTFTVYTSKNGLHDDVIFQILEDHKCYLWMSCNKGIFQVNRRELNDFAEGRIQSITCLSYGKDDGMKSTECIGESQPAGWKSRDGRLWFPTMKGVAVIDPNNIKINTVAPPVVIERVKVDDEFIEPGKNSEISPGKKRFEFHYTALSFAAPRKIKFKYKLEGFDEEWREVGVPTEWIAYYTNLSPGNYRFRVIACNNDGVWNKKGVSVSFFLKPFFYQTYWFYVLCAICLLLLGLGIHLLRVRQIIIRERRKYEKVRLTSESVEGYLKKLLHFMVKEKPYLEPDMSIHRLSENLMIPDHYISQVINMKLNQNFYDFINSYRIEEAKRILTHSKQKHLSILEVAFRVGFNSKSTFNRAFKKHAKKTPSDFKREQKGF